MRASHEVSEEPAYLMRAILSFLSKSSRVASRIFGIILGFTNAFTLVELHVGKGQ